MILDAGEMVMEESAGQPGGGEQEVASQAELLGAMEALRRRTRATRHGYWFPLALFGTLNIASIPFYIQNIPRIWGGSVAARSVTVSGSAAGGFLLGGNPSPGGSSGLAYYWAAALLGGLLLTQLWYWWHARRTGLATRSRVYFVTMSVLTVAAIASPLLDRLGLIQPADLAVRGTFAFIIIAASLLALAWAERSLALAVIAVLYSGAALLASLYDIVNVVARLGWNLPAADQALPNVLLPALVLVTGAAAAFAVRQHRRAA